MLSLFYVKMYSSVLLFMYLKIQFNPFLWKFTRNKRRHADTVWEHSYHALKHLLSMYFWFPVVGWIMIINKPETECYYACIIGDQGSPKLYTIIRVKIHDPPKQLKYNILGHIHDLLELKITFSIYSS